MKKIGILFLVTLIFATFIGKTNAGSFLLTELRENSRGYSICVTSYGDECFNPMTNTIYVNYKIVEVPSNNR